MTDQPFIVTKEHRRFTEFANAVRKEHTICHGDAGVGKTYSARRYANWDALEPYITEWRSRDAEEDAKHFSLANRSRTAFYTPEVLCRPRELIAEIHLSQVRIASCIDGHLRRNDPTTPRIMNGITKLVELVIIDEAERLTPTALELLRDNHDRTNLGIILIGMPGIDQRFRHYPQLYSRLGFSHRYRALGATNSCSSSTGTGNDSADHSTRTTSPTPRQSPQSNGSPAETSGYSSGSSPRSPVY